MKTDQLPLTETIYYLLLAFLKPNYGYIAIQLIEEMSNGTVRIAAGTMYGAIENLLKTKMIEQLDGDNPRRKLYQTTEYGKSLLQQDAMRMAHLIELLKKEGENHVEI